MINFWHKIQRQFFSYQKSDRNAIIVLLILIVLGIAINEIIKHSPVKSKYDYFKIAEEFEALKRNQTLIEMFPKKLFVFNPNSISEVELDSLLIPDFVKQNLINYRKAGGVFSVPSDINKLYGMNDSIFQEIEKYILIPREVNKDSKKAKVVEIKPEEKFDPNHTNKETLLYFGLNEFQADNLLRYRESGGKFYNASDLLVIYGFDTTLLNKIRENILINEIKTVQTDIAKEEFHVELNGADSIQLVRLNGIGPAFASRILKYRDLLGGFYNQSQLLEVYNFPLETYDNIYKNISVDSSKVKQIRINFAQYNDLIRHPYLNSNQVNSILTYREKNGAFESLSQLKNVSGFDSIHIRKISPYITCR